MLGFDKVIERACTTTGPDTFYSVMEYFMQTVQAEVIKQYDLTRRGFSVRKQADVIRTRLGKDFYAPSSAVDYSDSLRNILNKPPVTGFVPGESIFTGIIPEKTLPFYWRFQEFGTRPFTHLQPFIVKPGSGGSIKFHPVRKDLINNSSNTISSTYPGFLKTDYGLVKYVEVKNPGIKARNFLAYGKVYAQYSGPSIINGLIYELMSKLVNNHVTGSGK